MSLWPHIRFFFLLKPEAIYDEEKPHASLAAATAQFGLIGLNVLVMLLIQEILQHGRADVTNTIIGFFVADVVYNVLILMAISTITYVAAKFFGGTASFATHHYLTAAIMLPVVFLISLLILVNFDGNTSVTGLASGALVAYGGFLLFRTYKHAHGLGIGKTILLFALSGMLVLAMLYVLGTLDVFGAILSVIGRVFPAAEPVVNPYA